MSSATSVKAPDGQSPIRESLVKNGISNGRIGWNDNTSSVTIDGTDVYKPAVNINGTTYADDSAIRDMTRKAYAMTGDELVAARDYVTSKGYSGIVDWDGENAIIGGKLLKPIYIKDGISFIPKSEVEKAIADAEEKNGILGNDTINRLYNKKYGSAVDDAVDAILNRESFSYDPESDVAYKAYREQYTREAEDALRRVLNDNNTSLTGASGAVLSEAMSMRDQALRKLTDKIPELVDSAYGRYNDETQRLYDNLDELAALASDYYDRMYKADRDAVSEMVKAGAAEREENQRIITNTRNRENDYYENMLKDIEAEKGRMDLNYYDDMLEAEYNSMLLDNVLKQLEYSTNMVKYNIRQVEYDTEVVNYSIKQLEYEAMLEGEGA